jgi:hypothetical protein
MSMAMTYVTLVRSYTIGMVSKVVAWMEDTEKALIHQAVLPAKYDVDSPLVKCAIFFWVCKILKISQVKSAYLMEDYQLSQRSFNSILKILADNCAPVAKKIGSDVAELRKAQRQKVFPTATASVSGYIPSSSLKTGPPIASKAPTNKLAVNFEDSDPGIMDVDPVDDPFPTTNISLSTANTPLSITNVAPSPPPQPRRFRPIFLDRKQWSSRDPRIDRV